MILVKLCDFAEMAFACERHGMEYREICYSLCKSMSHQSFCPYFRNMSHNRLNVTASVNHYADNSNCLFICFCLILAFLVRIKICDFAKTVLECQHHDMGYREICWRSSFKHASSIFLY